jgi:hypothetical protein
MPSGLLFKYQPQTIHATTAAKNIPSYACCIVVYSVAQHHSTQL